VIKSAILGVEKMTEVRSLSKTRGRGKHGVGGGWGSLGGGGGGGGGTEEP